MESRAATAVDPHSVYANLIRRANYQNPSEEVIVARARLAEAGHRRCQDGATPSDDEAEAMYMVMADALDLDVELNELKQLAAPLVSPVQRKSKNGRTVLYQFCRKGRADAVAWLVQTFPDVDVDVKCRDQAEAVTPLELTFRLPGSMGVVNQDIALALLNAGARVDARLFEYVWQFQWNPALDEAIQRNRTGDEDPAARSTLASTLLGAINPAC